MRKKPQESNGLSLLKSLASFKHHVLSSFGIIRVLAALLPLAAWLGYGSTIIPPTLPDSIQMALCPSIPPIILLLVLTLRQSNGAVIRSWGTATLGCGLLLLLAYVILLGVFTAESRGARYVTGLWCTPAAKDAITSGIAEADPGDLLDKFGHLSEDKIWVGHNLLTLTVNSLFLLSAVLLTCGVILSILSQWRGEKTGEASKPPKRKVPSGPPIDTIASSTFDVFLSHNSKDKSAVRELKSLLEAAGVSAWLDENELRPGVPWPQLLEAGVKASRSIAVVVGQDGLGPWEDEEMQVALHVAVNEKRPVIPVLLPGTPTQPKLPAFLGIRTWVDLREGFTDAGVERLVWGITGKKP